MIQSNIKMSEITATTDDSEVYPQAEATFSGKTKDVIRLGYYGICSVPPVGSLGLCLNSGGQESTMFVISDDYLNRFKSLKPGEVKVGNYSQPMSYLYFKTDGNVTLTAPKLYFGSDAISLLEKLQDALTSIKTALDYIATAATYPTAVGPTGTMAVPTVVSQAVTEIDAVISDLATIDAGAV